MKKIAILGVADLRHMTMISMYTDYLQRNNIEYEIICSERYKDAEIAYEGKKVYKFPMMGMEAKKIVKLIYFLRFRRFAIKIMKKNQYDFVIVWGENTAVLFADYLKKRGNYCVNIRDSVFSKMPFFFARLTQAVHHSTFSTWCAQRGLELLPKHDYVIVLNQNHKLLQDADRKTNLCSENDVIRIGAIGAIRYLEDSKAFLKAMANDERYIMQFFGIGSEELERFTKEQHIKNVEFYGEFRPEETASLLDRIDVMNVYCGDGKNDINITLGSPIRFGYATYLYKPSIVSPNTRLSEKTKELGIGYTLDDIESVADDFYQWYHNIDFEGFKSGCDCYNQEFANSFERFYDVCDKYIKK